MEKEKGRGTDQTMQCKHSTPRDTLAKPADTGNATATTQQQQQLQQQQTNNRRSSSSNRSNALAVTGTRTTVVEEIKLIETATEGGLLFPGINVNDCATKFKFDDVYGC